MSGYDIFLSPEGAQTIERLLGEFVDATGVQCVMIVSRGTEIYIKIKKLAMLYIE